MKLQVEILSGPLDGKTYVFKNSITLGRSKDNDLVLDFDKFVSKKHANLLLEKKECFLEDLESTNGTFIDNEKITSKAPLENGQVVKLGRTNLKVSW